MENEILSLIKFDELLSIIVKSRKFLPETVGGFTFWMKRSGVPKSLTFEKWNELFSEYRIREVK